MSSSRLFEPLKIGNITVNHRIGMAPLTRMRATDERIPTPLMKEYYSQRAAVPGTLILTEGTFISPNCGGFPNAPGIWSDEQVEAWKPITEEVHRKGCFIFCQIFAMGRAAQKEVAEKEGVPIIAPSAIPIDADSAVPREMTMDEVKQVVLDHVKAAENAIKAGFDGVEVHGANGYMLDQFLQDTANHRTDAYGGSIENRTRLLHETIQAVAEAITPERVGLRLSPFSTFQSMRMADPIPQFTDVITKAKATNLAYIHLVESRISGASDAAALDSLDFAYELWGNDRPLLVAGGFTPLEAQQLVEERYPEKKIVVIFGRHFLANPDLVYRMRRGLELNAYNRETFYLQQSPVGYVDYKFSDAYLAEHGVVSGYK
ncbi:alkene reductase LALA0_S20e00122g [Lachancea lanzarotensis]|uniref:LALA0S20e00122g1_1 n=1 Tax=Lachancea lanzarotensis TaxID=1245769 RepID=A0A0C7NH77_9SACH|nr:uncharacterized protein LALA0_S20e00122g [Lachancea lanzarotensis]CEP65058.1 LALA0S20e00122g1_1 [Lachancea lanzarotensis]